MSFETLLKQTGIPERVETFSIEGTFPPDTYDTPFEGALEQMQKHNKKLKQLEYGEDVQRLLVKLAKTDRYPMIYCGGSLGRIAQFSAWDRLEWYDDRKVFVGMSLSLPSGRTYLHRMRQAQADLRALTHTRREALDGLELGLKNAYEQLETGRKRLDSTRALVALADKGYEISRKAYEVGSITLLDFQKSEFDLKSARLAFQAAQFEVHSTIVDIQALMGTL
jgi:outer membrane protein TolC